MKANLPPQILAPRHSTILILRVWRHDGTHTNATPRIHDYDARFTRTTDAVFPPIPSNERPNVRAILEHDARLSDVASTTHAPPERQSITEPPELPPSRITRQRHKPWLSIHLFRPTSHHNRELESGYYLHRSENPSSSSRCCPEMQNNHHGLGRLQWPAPRLGYHANSRRSPVRCDHVQQFEFLWVTDQGEA